ncbi:MAG: hypothetical protein HCA25_18085 [Dolichospermum sp. DET50]|nr:hypothetical protein [Dolichospermum sp. DET66]MBS3034126.1 hypothetical protein [Dolichospermum sp. DET67]MBS3039329.1 hypothetical protein [Dolichospermum sp. DET50]QSX66554.1 MAG: hypothetical protein EZY12_17355 [Dolichospermum sp. DET69]
MKKNNPKISLLVYDKGVQLIFHSADRGFPNVGLDISLNYGFWILCSGVARIYSGFRFYELHLSPLIACGEGVGGGVLVPHNTGKCCSSIIIKDIKNLIIITDSSEENIPTPEELGYPTDFFEKTVEKWQCEVLDNPSC